MCCALPAPDPGATHPIGAPHPSSSLRLLRSFLRGFSRFFSGSFSAEPRPNQRGGPPPTSSRAHTLRTPNSHFFPLSPLPKSWPRKREKGEQ